jgi:hypothetical protein
LSDIEQIVGNKMISKQEAMVQVMDLKLPNWLEYIETISLSNFQKLETIGGAGGTSSKHWLKQYAGQKTI